MSATPFHIQQTFPSKETSLPLRRGIPLSCPDYKGIFKIVANFKQFNWSTPKPNTTEAATEAIGSTAIKQKLHLNQLRLGALAVNALLNKSLVVTANPHHQGNATQHNAPHDQQGATIRATGAISAPIYHNPTKSDCDDNDQIIIW